MRLLFSSASALLCAACAHTAALAAEAQVAVAANFAEPMKAIAAVQVMEKLGLTDAVLLKKGAGNEAAKALLQLLQSPNIKDLIRPYGYGL